MNKHVKHFSFIQIEIPNERDPHCSMIEDKKNQSYDKLPHEDKELMFDNKDENFSRNHYNKIDDAPKLDDPYSKI